MLTQNSEVLEAFTYYCRQHPNEGFWLALHNWLNAKYAVNMIEPLSPSSCEEEIKELCKHVKEFAINHNGENIEEFNSFDRSLCHWEMDYKLGNYDCNHKWIGSTLNERKVK